jgi:hypothetical protein
MTRSQLSRLLRKTNHYFLYLYLIVLQHALHEIAQRSPEVFAPVCKTMLVNEQNVVLEACVQMWLEPQLNDDRVVVAVDVGVDTVETLEHVANERRECLREWNTNTTREHLLVVDVRLHPCHQVFDVFGSRHLGRSLVVFTVLPEVLKSTPC